MITTRQAAKIMDRVDYIARRLSDVERDDLARAALTLGEVRITTLDRTYWAQALQVFTDLAPSLAQELTHLLDTVEEIHRHIPPPDRRHQNGKTE